MNALLSVNTVFFTVLDYLGASAYGWWFWTRSKTEGNEITDVLYSPRMSVAAALTVTGLLSVALGYATRQIHVWAPVLFPQPASFPYLDAGTTIMSFTAMWLMARKRAESWIYWIVVDVIGIWLYFVKEVGFISLLYVVLLGMAVKGLVDWEATRRRTALLTQQALQPDAPNADA